ncbi:ABC transporter ATP-binding protein [Marinilabilia salmonicolor]|uniref:ABC transporter ATP-binding protein n=1 Tax=Marinilabilia salmonicolor TaxID=989 RepID=UPI00029ADC65|nr:ABC transporter ATP-binding protein [Marinilabilia salmonicolor]
MSNTVIKIENLSKIYRLGEIGTGTLSHDLNRWWAMNIRGKDDPYALVGGVNDRTAKATKGEHIAALKDINLEVKQGEVLGIIGKNGAGKSTLLKVLSRVTSPTTGSISVKGRLASLLEVGTGFHPEMTGRENIYMNGTIMGMRKWEISRKLDEIVEFAGVAKYLDTPVKRYSSGMTVRLGFAVAAHLEPEILVVDEVLAVGDAEFQKKAIGKMQDVSTNDGRTVLFVSHNMASVKKLCNRGVLIQNGNIIYGDTADKTVDFYQRGNAGTTQNQVFIEENDQNNKGIQPKEIKLTPLIGENIDVESGVKIFIKLKNHLENSNITSSINIFTTDDIQLFEAPCFISQNKDSKKGTYELLATIPPYFLNADKYRIKLVVAENQKYVLYKNENILTFEIEDTSFNKGHSLNKVPGILRPKITWEVIHS